MKIFAALILIFCNLQSNAQNEKIIEQHLLKTFKQVGYWADHREFSDKVNYYDSLAAFNDLFLTDLLKYTSTYPQTLSYKLQALQTEGLLIATSGDSLLRIYSWDTYMGGTMHIYYSVYQYKSGNVVYSGIPGNLHNEGEAGVFYSAIHTVNGGDKTYYLGVSQSVLSTKESYQTIKAFQIKNNALNDTVKIIKTKTGIKNELGFDFDFFSVINHTERPLKLVFYDKEKKIIKIPVVTPAGKVTSKFIQYKFTGRYFEKIELPH